MKKKIRYAVVGLGHIAQTAVLPAFKNAKSNSELAALISDDPKKLKVLAKKYGVSATASYDDYESCLQMAEIDAVYIATPNSLHLPFVLKAAEMGIHILCEKPLAVTEEECDLMIAAARKNKVKLMTAYRLHFEKANLTAVDIAKSGKLGELRYFNSVFSYEIKDSDNIRLQKDKGGGPLYDIGTYCLNASRYIFQEEPTEVFAVASTRKGDERFSEVEEMMTAILKYPNQKVASFTCSFGAAARSRFEVVGTKGSVALENAFEYVEPMEMEITIKEKKQKRTFAKKDQFAPELAYFSDCVLKNREPEPSGLEGKADVRILEALKLSAKQGKPVKVSAVKKTSRPNLRLEMKKPPVRKVGQIHATSPHS